LSGANVAGPAIPFMKRSARKCRSAGSGRRRTLPTSCCS
jgi:hypothetical protein